MASSRSILALIGLTIIVSACQKQQEAKKKQDSGPIPVETARVTTRHLQRIVDSVGTLFPYDEVIVSAEIEGKVEKVEFDLGDNVKQGDVLVRISDEEQRYLLLQNEAQLRMSLERLGLKSEKDRVKDIRDTPEVRRAAADLRAAEQRFQRLRNLVDQKIGAQADLDQASAQFQAAQASHDSTVNQTRNLVQEVERFKAIVELQRKKLRDTTVRAPFPGSVKERLVTTGQYVRANTPLFTLVKINPLRLRLEVPERLAPWTKVNQTAEVTLEAFQDRIFRGRVWRIAPVVDQTKRTFVVEVLIDNPEGLLKPGSYARAKLTTEKMDDVKIVPAKAVQYILGANKAYVIKNDTIDAREVKVGDRVNQDLEILEGLSEGDLVATSQLIRLDTGSKVRIVEAQEKHSEKLPAKSGQADQPSEAKPSE
ncbi:MAG: efflux RND transporter periplasmic adaptor subunit [Bryobacterales bacterium]|nr:efflux RND transporter periplasmic adaptor subunit [Bryobacterales bacterium]